MNDDTKNLVAKEIRGFRETYKVKLEVVNKKYIFFRNMDYNPFFFRRTRRKGREKKNAKKIARKNEIEIDIVTEARSAIEITKKTDNANARGNANGREKKNASVKEKKSVGNEKNVKRGNGEGKEAIQKQLAAAHL